jgi:[acyl-carrier-protein] S-malonyltransferase
MHSQLAFVFPGQGSQQLGMLKMHAQQYPQVQACFEEASKIVGKNLWELTLNGPEEFLNKTENTQPVLLASSVALWRIWQSLGGPVPKLLAGHSLGEYTALVCAKAISFSDAIRLVYLRGKAMQQAVPEGVGAMAAVLGLDDAILNQVLDEVREQDVLSVANYNSIGQTVIAGHTQAIDRAAVLAKTKGAKRVLKLPVSVPSHCPLMTSAGQTLAQELNKIKIVAPMMPVIHNVNVDITTHPDDIRDYLVKQLYSPVRWVETIQRFSAEGITHIVECGPGKVLTGLIKRIDEKLNTYNLDPIADLESTLTKLG